MNMDFTIAEEESLFRASYFTLYRLDFHLGRVRFRVYASVSRHFSTFDIYNEWIDSPIYSYTGEQGLEALNSFIVLSFAITDHEVRDDPAQRPN